MLTLFLSGVIPANVGTQCCARLGARPWIPAFAGMTPMMCDTQPQRAQNKNNINMRTAPCKSVHRTRRDGCTEILRRSRRGRSAAPQDDEGGVGGSFLVRRRATGFGEAAAHHREEAVHEIGRPEIERAVLLVDGDVVLAGLGEVDAVGSEAAATR